MNLTLWLRCLKLIFGTSTNASNRHLLVWLSPLDKDCADIWSRNVSVASACNSSFSRFVKVRYLDINNLAPLTKKLGSKQNCWHWTFKVPPVTLDEFPSTRPRSLFWFSTRSKIFGMHSQMLETFKFKVLLYETTKTRIRAPAVEPLVDSEVKYLTLCYHIDGFCVVLVRSTLTKASWTIRRRWNFMFWKFPTQRCRAERKKPLGSEGSDAAEEASRKSGHHQTFLASHSNLLWFETGLSSFQIQSWTYLRSLRLTFRPALVKRTVYSEGPWTATSWRGGWTSAAQTVDFPWLSDSPSSAPRALRHEQRRTLPVQRHREVQQQHQEQMA